jgi:transposase-like protein
MSATHTEQRTPELLHPLPYCPSCGSVQLEPVVEADTQDVHFLCRDCKRCWHVELGFVHRMAPRACHGCPHLSDCKPVYESDVSRSAGD